MFSCQSIADVGGRSCLHPGPSWPSTPSARSRGCPRSPEPGWCRRGGEQDGGAWSFDDFNYQIFSTSGWKIGIKASLEPGFMLAPANAACPGAGIAFLMGSGMKPGTGMPQAAGSLLLPTLAQREDEMLDDAQQLPANSSSSPPNHPLWPKTQPNHHRFPNTLSGAGGRCSPHPGAPVSVSPPSIAHHCCSAVRSPGKLPATSPAPCPSSRRSNSAGRRGARG